MKNIVGQIASKKDFFPRPREIRRITRNLHAGANIQLAAPRRVGKSSILVYMKDNPMDGYIFIYVDVESARTQDDFYRKLYKEILKNEILNNKKELWKQFQDGANKFLKRLKNIKIMGIGEIELDENESVNYEEELLNFLIGLDLKGDHLVIMVDEFPEILLNMIEDSDGDFGVGRAFLQSNRAFRNNQALQGKVQFIYTGSNSLNVTASMMGSTELINDIPATPVGPLHEKEAEEFVRNILEEYGYKIDADELHYAIQKVEWFIPFYFQMLIQEIINQIEPDDSITNNVIDLAMEEVTNQRNNHHFEHYIKRLNRIFDQNELNFTKLILNHLANNDTMGNDEVMNFAYGIVGEDQAKRVIRSLISDGYINCSVVDKNAGPIYKFTSPILKMWWCNNR